MSATVEQRPFGRTGEKVTVIGLGGAALHKHAFEQGVATVKHALDLGVTYFDTSPGYGIRGPDGRWISAGESQLIMGKGLDGATKPHLLATKLSLSSFRTIEDCRAQIQDNLQALRRDRVDVLLGHGMERAKMWKPDARDDELLDLDEELEYHNAAVIQALREAKAQGLCRYMGLSADRSASLAHVLKRVELDMCLSANEYSLLSRRSPQVMLPVIREQGLAYVVGGIFSIAGQGAFNGAIFSDEQLIKLAKTTGISIAALTVRFLIANREITTILVGASTPQEIEESVLAAQAGPLPPDIYQTLEALESKSAA